MEFGAEWFEKKAKSEKHSHSAQDICHQGNSNHFPSPCPLTSRVRGFGGCNSDRRIAAGSIGHRDTCSSALKFPRQDSRVREFRVRTRTFFRDLSEDTRHHLVCRLLLEQNRGLSRE